MEVQEGQGFYARLLNGVEGKLISDFTLVMDMLGGEI